jgi:hypothetical protein
MKTETVFHVDRMDELKEVRLHCTKSGFFIHWQLAPARGATFVDAESGVEPIGAVGRILDVTTRLWNRRYLAAALAALQRAAAGATASDPSR